MTWQHGWEKGSTAPAVFWVFMDEGAFGGQSSVWFSTKELSVSPLVSGYLLDVCALLSLAAVLLEYKI